MGTVTLAVDFVLLGANKGNTFGGKDSGGLDFCLCVLPQCDQSILGGARWVWLMLVSAKVEVVTVLLGQLQPDAGNVKIDTVTHAGSAVAW